MRTIKYRGMDEHGCWHVGWLVGTNDGFIYIIENDNGWIDDGFHDDDFSGCYEVLEKTIGQFTGLFDKNGKEIYEGDILRMFANINKISDPMLSNAEPKYRLTTVVYDDAAFKVTSDGKPDAVINYYCGAMVKDMEVIGNIHDNPELLKTETL